MPKPLIAALLLAGLAAPAAAQSVYGTGGKPCRQWTADLKKKWPHLGNVDWLMGYVSGINRGRGPGSAIMGQATVEAADGFVTSFCAGNPDRPIFEAADALIVNLQPR